MLTKESSANKNLQPLTSKMLQSYHQESQLSGSKYTNESVELLKKISNLTHSHLVITPSGNANTTSNKSLDDKLYEATSQAKILTSKVSNLIKVEYRRKLFAQLDDLHDIEDWNSDDTPLHPSSFSTFLKTFILINPTRYPGLGISNSGYLIGAWTVGPNRLTIEFLPGDKVKWVLSRSLDESAESERSTSISPVSRLLECLSPWHPDIWFYKNE